MARYYIFFVIILLLGVACGSLMPRQARPPKVDCPAEPVATIAILCVKGVALRLGPADEIESYDSIHGFRLLILPRNLAQSIFPHGVSSPMVLTSPIPQLGEDALKHQHTSDRQGNIWASVAPGSYLICAITESAAVPGEEAGRCELAMLGEGSLTRLLITHTPSGDRLEFDWPDGRPPVTLISGDAMAPPATIRPIKTPERSSGTTATIPNPPFLPEDPRTKDLRKYVDAWPEERKLVIERLPGIRPHPFIMYLQCLEWISIAPERSPSPTTQIKKGAWPWSGP